MVWGALIGWVKLQGLASGWEEICRDLEFLVKLLLATVCVSIQVCSFPVQTEWWLCLEIIFIPPLYFTFMHEVLSLRDRWRRKCMGSIFYYTSQSTHARLSLEL